jgi:murein DD-endopeptidase MepM/ murein hydrolase activator NlpD
MAALVAALAMPASAAAAGASRAPAPIAPTITITSPRSGESFQEGSRVFARYRCSEPGHQRHVISSCHGTVPHGSVIDTSSVGVLHFTVTATLKNGHRYKKTADYTVWRYTNPMRSVQALGTGRIDMGVDYSGYGPILALGAGKVVRASNHDAGPLSCWGKTCWPGGGIVIYRLSAGPFAGKFVYVAENIAVNVKEGQHVKAGQQIATLRDASPNMETGWASGQASETLAFADNHECNCGDPGGWSSIEGRNFNGLLVLLGAPSGYLQSSVPQQSMPAGWPSDSGVRRH